MFWLLEENKKRAPKYLSRTTCSLLQMKPLMQPGEQRKRRKSGIKKEVKGERSEKHGKLRVSWKMIQAKWIVILYFPRRFLIVLWWNSVSNSI
jgi:hypothetical protein